MNRDIFNYCIHIESPGKLLLWLMLLCIIGLIITGWPMVLMSRFFRYAEGKVSKLQNHTFSIIHLELPFSYERFEGLVNNITQKTKDTIKMQLKLDYYFMCFIYPLLFFAGCYVLWCSNLQGPFYHRYRSLLLAPFAAWLFDIIENKLISSSLSEISELKTRALLGSGLTKYLIAAIYSILLVAGFVQVCLT